jgi:2-oxoisovalerate dehydrogenase E1 component
MVEIRALENNIAELLSKAILKGASHLYAGQEAVAVGAIAALRDDDLITSTHRGHGHAHAHGDRAAKTPETQQGILKEIKCPSDSFLYILLVR